MYCFLFIYAVLTLSLAGCSWDANLGYLLPARALPQLVILHWCSPSILTMYNQYLHVTNFFLTKPHRIHLSKKIFFFLILMKSLI